MSLGPFIDLGMSAVNNMFADERQEDAQQFAAGEAATARAFNSAEAAKSRDWQANMRATQYRTAVYDMQQAGLNPMLAYHQGGAGTPPGASASASGGTSGIASPGSSHSVAAGLQSASQIEVNDAMAERIKAEASKIRAEEAEIKERTPTHAVNIQQMHQQIAESQERIRRIIQETATSASSAAHLDQQVINLKEAIPQIRATVQQLEAHTRLSNEQAKLAVAHTGLSHAQIDEIRQRIRENLPHLQNILSNLEATQRRMSMPGREADAAAQTSFVGQLGAYLRAINPLKNLFSEIPR